jgi:hypothetical protein
MTNNTHFLIKNLLIKYFYIFLKLYLKNYKKKIFLLKLYLRFFIFTNFFFFFKIKEKNYFNDKKIK